MLLRIFFKSIYKDKRIITLDSILDKSEEFDICICISIIEHMGLGRYGDEINPLGDFKFKNDYFVNSKFMKKGGLIFLSFPVGKDCLVWNAHRIYGTIRLPNILEDLEVIDTFGLENSLGDNSKLGEYVQPIFVIRK